MLQVRAIHDLPGNFPEFVDEIAEGLSDLYGPQAASRYRYVAPRSLQAILTHTSVRALAVLIDPSESSGSAMPLNAAGMAVALIRDAIGQVSLIHVLHKHADLGVESSLLRHLVSDLREEGVQGIVCELVPTSPIDMDSPFTAMGFKKIERLLMSTPLSREGLARPTLRESQPLSAEIVPDVADAIVDAYVDHPGRNLHAEVRHLGAAEGFLQSALTGGFGSTRASYSRVVRRDGRVVAALIGCEVAPGVGFVLQVVVRRAYQRRGLGTLLLQEVAQCFYEGGLDRMALGVTSSNPARRLYERLGFRKHRPVNAYVWWQDTCDPVRETSRIQGERNVATHGADGASL